MALKEAQHWIKTKFESGERKFNVTCNPIQRKLFLESGKDKLTIDCQTQRETRLLKDILRDYVERLLGKDNTPPSQS